jgi:hypothetical protein
VEQEDDLVLLAKEEVDMIDKIIEIGRCYGMERNVENKSNENFKTTISSTTYDRSKTTGELGIF